MRFCNAKAETVAGPAETDDRRNVFSVATGKRAVTLQALTEAERNIWIAGVFSAYILYNKIRIRISAEIFLVLT